MAAATGGVETQPYRLLRVGIPISSKLRDLRIMTVLRCGGFLLECGRLYVRFFL
jgi:hypothetical protein